MQWVAGMGVAFNLEIYYLVDLVKCKVEFHSENLFLQVETTFTKPFIQWTKSSRKRVETRCSTLFRL